MSLADASYLHIPTIPRDFIRQMVAHLSLENDLNPEARRQLEGLLAQEKLSIAQYTSFYRLLGECLDDELLGFLPKPVPRGSQKVLCQMLYYSPDIATALEHYNQFYSLFLNPGESLLDLSALRQQQRVILNSVSEQSQQPMFQQSIVMALLNIPTWLAGQKISLASLSFNFSAMPFNDEFNYLFGIVPSFAAEKTSVQYSAASLAYPIKPKESAEDFGGRYMERSLYWSMRDDIVRRVYAEVSHRLLTDNFDVVHIAATMNISKHTLARRLKACNSSYSEILERVRRDKSLYLLLNSQQPIEQIACQLGFKELGSFSRAFKSWTQTSPRQYRDKASATIC